MLFDVHLYAVNDVTSTRPCYATTMDALDRVNGTGTGTNAMTDALGLRQRQGQDEDGEKS